MDIVKVFKEKDNSAQKEIDCEEELSKLCFQNKAKSTVKIKVEQKGEENGEVTELIIPAKQKECSFIIAKGIYKYEISLPSEKGDYEPIRKGEFNIRDCIEINVKVEDP